MTKSDIRPLVGRALPSPKYDVAEDQVWVPDDVLWPSVPAGGGPLGGYAGAVLHLARALRDHFPEGTATDRFRGVVRRWLALAERAAPGRVIHPGEQADVFRAFARAFPAVTTPLSDSRPMRLMRAAADGCPGDKTDSLLAACRALAGALGGEFDLSVRVAASVLGVTNDRARLKLQLLVRRGDLVLVEPSASRRRGHRYRLGPAGG